MQETDPTSERIAELLVHIGCAARGETPSSDLTAAQWTCLRFFARANASTRTPSAFASFHATTRGTASQIIKTLEQRGLLSRRRSEHDGRSVCLDVTDRGQALLARDPLLDLVSALDNLGPANREMLRLSLARVAHAIAEIRATPSFGTCLDCSHFTPSGAAPACACLSMRLSADQIGQLCQNYGGAGTSGVPVSKDTPIP